MIPMQADNRWIVRRGAAGVARMRLFCFPFAGGGASTFLSWPKLLPPGVELCAVQLPGREGRAAEPPLSDWPTLMDQLAAAIGPWMDLPFAFFGHSLGAAVAFGLSVRLHQEGRAGPRRLWVSGRPAPHFRREPPIHHLPEPEFVDELRKLDGTPEEVLQSAELMEILLPVLRADFGLSESHRCPEGVSLPIPLCALAGERDPYTPPHKVEGWREYTTSSFRKTFFPGGHFFLNENRDAVLAEIRRTLHSDLENGAWKGIA